MRMFPINGMMLCRRGFHGFGMFLPKLSPAFDIGEEKGDGTGWKGLRCRRVGRVSLSIVVKL